MKVLHLLKTSRGERWASSQARVLSQRGVEVHAALPDLDGSVADEWISNGAHVSCLPYSLSLAHPNATRLSILAIRRLVDRIQPDLVHAHSVKAATLARLALRKHSGLPRIFQVPGPLHLESTLFRNAELSITTADDYWIATSKAIRSLYVTGGVSPDRVFLSYAGTDNSGFREPRSGWLRKRLGIPDDEFIVGNASYIYSPKWYLFQKRGLKCHEDLIDGISLASIRDPSIRGVLIGGPWGPNGAYFETVRRYAAERSRGRVLMPGFMTLQEIALAMPDFDCVAHVPSSENCGGVVEPLLCGIPTIATRIGGLPEVIMDGHTGMTVPVHSPEAIGEAILTLRNDYEVLRARAMTGRRLVETMFDARRTAVEVHEIYRVILGERRCPPVDFDSQLFLQGIPTSR